MSYTLAIQDILPLASKRVVMDFSSETGDVPNLMLVIPPLGDLVVRQAECIDGVTVQDDSTLEESERGVFTSFEIDISDNSSAAEQLIDTIVDRSELPVVGQQVFHDGLFIRKYVDIPEVDQQEFDEMSQTIENARSNIRELLGLPVEVTSE